MSNFDTVVLDGEMGLFTKVREGDLPYYTGATEVTPSDQTQTLQTADTVVTSNITIKPIPDMELETKSVTYTPTESEQTDTITASSGYDAIEEVNVTVEAIDSDYVGSNVPRNDSSDLTASGATVTAPAGYYESDASSSVANGTEGTPTATKGAVSNHSVSVTPSVTNTTGYITGGTKTGTAVTVSASELVSGNKTITANGTGIDVTEYATVSVAVPGDTPTLQTKSVSYTPTESSQSATVTADQGYDGLDEVNISVGAISSSYVGSAIDRRDSTDLSASGATVTAPAGYYASAASKSVASGSASTPATTITANPSISVDSSGLVTATASASQNVTPTVSAGYVSSGTSGTVTVSGSATEQLTTQAAQTIHPSTSDQTIASGKYLTGAQTIKAVTTTNLTAANIVSGVTVEIGDSDDSDCVASVTGTASGGGSNQISLSYIRDLGTAGLRYAVLPDTCFFENLGAIGTRCLADCTGGRIIVLPSIGAVNQYSMADSSDYEIIDLGPNMPNITTNYFFSEDTKLATLIIRKSSVVTINNVNEFNMTPFDSGGTGGTLYVPSALISSYQSASNWSTILGYTNNSILAIEGSYYETHYADGTPIPTT